MMKTTIKNLRRLIGEMVLLEIDLNSLKSKTLLHEPISSGGNDGSVEDYIKQMNDDGPGGWRKILGRRVSEKYDKMSPGPDRDVWLKNQKNSSINAFKQLKTLRGGLANLRPISPPDV